MDELNKEELIVEARMRRIQTDDSWTAAKILAAVKEKQYQQVHYSLHCPQVIDISSEIKAFQVAKHVMEDYFERVMQKPTSHKKVRLCTRLKHWMFRIMEIKHIVNDNELQQIETIESVFQGYLNELLVLPTQDKQVNFQFNENKPNVEEGATFLLPNESFSGPEEDQLANYSHDVVRKDNDGVENTWTHVQKQAHKAITSPSPFEYEQMKLPNPISGILKQASEFNVTNHPSILQFLNSFTKLRRQASFLKLQDNDVLKIIYPYTRGILSDFVLQAIENQYSLKQFHTEFLATYLPLTVINRFISTYVLRPQYSNECLGDYIHQVKLHADMFETTYSESQLVEIIIMNASRSEVRSLYLSNSPPKTFLELSNIASKLNLSDTGEMLRSAPPTPQVAIQAPRSKPEKNLPQIQYEQQHKPSSQNQYPAQTQSSYGLICFYCGKAGHIRRNCRARKRSQLTSQSE